MSLMLCILMSTYQCDIRALFFLSNLGPCYRLPVLVRDA